MDIKLTIALGIEDYLDNFAADVSAVTWKRLVTADPGDWRSEFLRYLADEEVRFCFNLTGVNVESGVALAASGEPSDLPVDGLGVAQDQAATSGVVSDIMVEGWGPGSQPVRADLTEEVPCRSPAIECSRSGTIGSATTSSSSGARSPRTPRATST